MARKATGTKGGGSTKSSARKAGAGAKARKPSRAVSSRSGGSSGGDSRAQDGMGDAFIKLLQSPLVADLVAVAATAALAALAEHGFSSRGASGNQRRAGRAVKEAGKAAASAIGRRLSTELEEIRASTKKSKAGAGA